jgi:TolA-binding protein
MESIINEQKPQQQPPSPAFRTLEQKIDELVNGIREIRDIIWNRRKRIRQQLKEIIQLAQDLSIDDMQLRDMIYESCTRMDVSPSWLRKMLPKNLKLTKHTRKDYLKRQLQRDQQPLPSDNEEKTAATTTKVTTYDDDNHSIAVIPLLTQKENEGLVEESSDDKNKRIEKLNERIEELQQEITYLRGQQQKQQEEKFTALGYLQLLDNDVPIKVTVNVKTKSIEWMEADRERIKKIIRMTSYEKTIT